MERAGDHREPVRGQRDFAVSYVGVSRVRGPARSPQARAIPGEVVDHIDLCRHDVLPATL
jgi:hypothetical protein